MAQVPSVPHQLYSAFPADIHSPDFRELDKLKKIKLVNKLRHQWSSQPRPAQLKLTPAEVAKVAEQLCTAYDHLCDKGDPQCLSRFACQTFIGTTDLLGPHPNGTTNVHECILTMAEFVFRLNKPVLAKRGFSQELANVAELDQMMLDQVRENGDDAVFEPIAQYYHKMCFGRNSDLADMTPHEVHSVRNTSHLIWMGLLASKTPPLASFMSYIHHLALPPLERRFRSYARTIAFTESILSNTLQTLRQHRASAHLEGGSSKKERVIWILNATESHMGMLAQEGYFEDAAAFKSEYETITIYLITKETESDPCAGTWPCGKRVKVHWVNDHSTIADLPRAELAFMFHFDPSSTSNLNQLLMVTHEMATVFRPMLVITCRCEPEVQRLRTILDLLGLCCSWPLIDTPGHQQRDCLFARNLYSGMAGDPDIEYDDNGWMAAVFRSNLPHEKLLAWLHNTDYYITDLHRLMMMDKDRVKWTSQFVLLCSAVPNLLPLCGYPQEGDELTRDQLLSCQYLFGERWETTTATLIDMGYVQSMSPEEIAAADAKKQEGEPQGAEAQPAPQAEAPDEESEGGEELEYRVVYTRIMVRAEPSTKAQTVGMYSKDALVRGVPVDVEGDKWLRIQYNRGGPPTQAKGGQAKREAQDAFMLIDGSKLGLGVLLERTEKEAEAAERKPAAEAQRGARSPAVFWGILDLKYDSGKPVEAQVKVLETGDGRLSRFSGVGASIKEQFQHDHKLEETLRRAVITENKKLTHDVIVDHGYLHLRPRQQEFRREYTDDLAESIKEAFGFSEEDICVLKLCNRARGAGVIPVNVADLDQVLQELLQPPKDIEAWFRQQPQDWARKVTWGCFEEQVRHWWTNECPCFLVEECCLSMPTEKDGRQFDGTMRVGFSLHREHRNKLPPGWVDSPDGPIRVRRDDGEAGPDPTVRDAPPRPWNDGRRYLDLFRLESSFLRVQWLGGYWKLPIEDMTSQDLRGKIVSVAKQGTAPVPDYDLHIVYAAMGNMVSLLFGTNDMSQHAIRARYKSFPELASFMIARLACSIRSSDKAKSFQLMDLAKMYVEKEAGLCKDFVTSYIHRNLGVAEAGHKSQWEKAAEHFRKSLQAMPTNANSLHLLALHHLELGVPQKAAELFESTLLLDPDFKAPYACLGVARLRMGQYQRAAETSAAGLARHPYTQACHYNLGVASFALAFLQEQEKGPGHIASELRARALEELETARDTRFRDQPWELADDTMVAQLRNERAQLNWSERRLPRDGWRVMGWRP